MASSSASSSYLKQSRFSTLKVFKLGSKDKELKPPPPPPKDPYYLANKSLGSLSPDSLSLPPNSPHSPQSNFQYPRGASPGPNQSTMSLASSAASMKSSPPADQRQPKKEKSRGFLKFGRRSPKSPPTAEGSAEDGDPPPPDDGISMPWNFQHNIHVDEGYVGLPPSWATSLADAGFSEDEIVAIQTRRATGTRSPGSQYLYTDRPASPSTNHPYLNITASPPPPPPVPVPPILKHPKPRSTSLARQVSDTSLKSTAQHAGPVPTLPAIAQSPSSASLPSTTSCNPNGTTSMSSRIPPPRRRPPSPSASSTHHTSSSVSTSTCESHQSALNGSQEQGGRGALGGYGGAGAGAGGGASASEPSPPSRRPFYVTNANASVQPNSPPPAYGNSSSGYLPEKQLPNPATQASKPPAQQPKPPAQQSKTPAPGPQSQPQASSSSVPQPAPAPIPNNNNTTPTKNTQHRPTPSTSSSSSSPSPVRITPLRTKRTTALPPRLSLHKSSDSADLSMWSEALLSGISSGSLMDDDATTGTGTTASSGSHVQSPPQHMQSPPQQGQRSYFDAQQQQRQPQRAPPTRVAPLPPLSTSSSPSRSPSRGGGGDSDSPVPASAYAEPAQTARYTPLSPHWSEHSPSPGSASSPLWHELEGIVGVSAGPRQHMAEEPMYSAALTESYSPTLPFSPPNNVAEPGAVQSFSLGGAGSLALEEHLDGDGDEDELGEEDEHFLGVHGGRAANRDSSRSSSSTLTVTGLGATTIVRNVSIARRMGAYVIDKSKPSAGQRTPERRESLPHDPADAYGGAYLSSPVATTFASSSSSRVGAPVESKHPPSPLSSHFGSSEEESASGSTSTSSSSQSQDHPTPTTEAGMDSPLLYYLDGAQSPDPSVAGFSPHPMKLDGVHKEPSLPADETDDEDALLARRPKIVISNAPTNAPGPTTSTTTPGSTPLSPFQRYRGWLSEVVAPLEEFIDETVDPRDHYLDLQEIAEGESGSVFAARLSDREVHRLKLPPLVKAKDTDDIAAGRISLVAIKSVAIVPSGSPKLNDLKKELTLMRGLWHENVLSMDAVYVDLVEDSLWIRMELMERSLADIVGLVGDGLMLQDRMIARFASDVLNALDYLQQYNIAHRDVRSDNLLLDSRGVLKLTDFSTAVQVTQESPMSSDLAGVVYWQAPEVRTPPYNALKVDVWSLGATVWEMAETEPPFSDTQQLGDRWPPLSTPELYSPAFHDFLRRCSEPASSRPAPGQLMKTSFINNACGRPVIVQLLAQCMAIEKVLQDGQAPEPADLE